MKENACGMSFFSVLGLIFVVLKLVGKIDWSWWWVLSPFIAQGVILVVCVAVWILCERALNKYE